MYICTYIIFTIFCTPVADIMTSHIEISIEYRICINSNHGAFLLIYIIIYAKMYLIRLQLIIIDSIYATYYYL